MNEQDQSDKPSWGERTRQRRLEKALGKTMPEGGADLAKLPRRSWFRLVIFVPILMFIFLSGWAFSSPIGSTPDSDYHLPSIWCGLGDRPGLCQSTDNPGIKEATKAIATNPDWWLQQNRDDPSMLCFIFHGAKCQNEWIEQNSHELSPTTRINSGSGKQYDDYYYAIMSTMASQDIYASVWTIRLVNAGIFVLMGALLYLALPKTRRQALLMLWTLGMAPLTLFLVPSTNPNSWTITMVVSVFMAMLGFMETRGGRRICLGVLASIAIIMASIARQDGPVYSVLAIAIATLLQARTKKTWWRWFIWPGALVVFAAVIYLGYPRNPISQGLPANPTNTENPVNLFVQNLVNTPILIFDALSGGSLAWFNIPTPIHIQSMIIVAIFIIVGFSMSFGGARKAIAAILLIISLWLFPMYILTLQHVPVGNIVQARYMIPLALMFIAVMLYSKTGKGINLRARYLWPVFILMSTAGIVMLFIVNRYYKLGLGTPDAEKAIWWWPNFFIGPRSLVAIASLAFVLALLLMLWDVRQIRRDLDRDSTLQKALALGREEIRQAEAAGPATPALVSVNTGVIPIKAENLSAHSANNYGLGYAKPIQDEQIPRAELSSVNSQTDANKTDLGQSESTDIKQEPSDQSPQTQTAKDEPDEKEAPPREKDQA